MGWFRRIVVGLSGLIGACGCLSGQTYATDALQHGSLVVWVVSPARPAQRTSDQERARLHTSTAGSFGRTAGSVGQTAGSYGTSPSGLPALSPGKTAGEVGQTAGSFGQSLDTLAAASTVASGAVPPPPVPPVFVPTAIPNVWQGLTSPLGRVYPDFKATFVPVSAEDLRERFAAIGHGVEQPDLLFSNGSLEGPQLAFLRELSVASLGRWPEVEPGEPAGLQIGGVSYDWKILKAAAHPEEARALVVWLEDGSLAQAERYRAEGLEGGPVSVAIEAAQSALGGGEIGAADPELAHVPPGRSQWAAFTPPDQSALSGLGLRVDVLRWAANERFAVYGLRVIANSERAFGVAYPLVVLRRGENGRWGVLQVSANLGCDRMVRSFRELARLAGRVRPELVKAVMGVTLAAPKDGDTRSGVPELWWDNPGDARLLAVEWQVGGGDTHLMLVPETASRLQVRVTAAFASGTGAYRWRVWALGTGGTTKLSPWRGVTVVQ